VWIHHLERHPRFGPAASRVIECVEEGRFKGIVSDLTLLELTVRPLQLGRQDVAEYELLLSYFPNLELEPVSREILIDAAGLRARTGLRTADAILAATGIHCAATAAVTNDGGWKAVASAGIEPVILSEGHRKDKAPLSPDASGMVESDGMGRS
jgi:predicted nucleic acid-binding protein